MATALDSLQVRRHGFNRPISPLQMILVFVISLDTIMFALLYLPQIKDFFLQLLLAVTFALTAIIMIAAGFKAAITDPSHPDVPWKCGKGSFDDLGKTQLPLCHTCHVRQEWRTEHCNTCNRCVTGFDHHCIWLNNCIGSANYRSFWIAMVSATLFLGLMCLTGLVLFVVVIKDGQPQELLLPTTAFLTLLNAALFVLIFTLLVFHIKLVSKRLTTLEYIMAHLSYDRALEFDMEPPVLEDGSLFVPFPRCIDWVVFRPRRKRKGKIAPAPAPAEKPSLPQVKPVSADTVDGPPEEGCPTPTTQLGSEEAATQLDSLP